MPQATLPDATRRSRFAALVGVCLLMLVAWLSPLGWAASAAPGERISAPDRTGEQLTSALTPVMPTARARSAPTIRITRSGSEFPNGGWIANRLQQFVVHLCTDQTIGTTSVTSSYGHVDSDAQALCDYGQSGTAYFLTYDEYYNNPLLDGPNTFSASACNQAPYDYECTYFNGLINYGPLLDPLVSSTPLEPGLIVRKGTTDTVAIRVTNGHSYSISATPTYTCTAGLASCTSLNNASIPANGVDTLLVSVTATEVGVNAVSTAICHFDSSTQQDKCGYGWHPANVLPLAPVAANVVVNASTASTNKGQGATFALIYRVVNTGTKSTNYSLQAICPASIVASGCTVSPASPTINAGDSATVTIGTMTATSPAQLTTAAVTLTAWAGGATATGQTAVTVGPNGGTGGSSSIAVASLALNPQGSVSRDQCLSVAAGEAAGVECGDLRLAHGLPGFQTMSKARAPTLVYLSRHARPVQLLTADVTVLRATPSTVNTTLTIPGKTPITRAYAWPTTCHNITCRIVVPVDAEALSLATGAYSYTLEVSASGIASPATDTGTFALVNRTTSPFGRGWWVSGLEQLVSVPGDLTRLLWVGGDGSTRLYKKVSIESNTYLSVYPVSRPDTLVRYSDTELRRLLPNKAYVTFNTSGEHTSTVNSQGHITTLKYASGRLDSLILPVPSGSTARPHYKFHFATSGSAVIDSVIAVRNSASRRLTKIHRYNTWRIARIVDPDTTLATRFDSTSSTGRIGARVSRAGAQSNFTYDSLGAVSQTEVVVPTATNITTNFCPAETRSLVVCPWGPSTALGGVTLPNAVTRMDGARSTLIDVVSFHINRFGAPDSLQDPNGGRTRLERSTAFPALVTKMTDAMGQVQRAVYNARGLVDSLISVNPLGTSVDSKTTITWHGTWALPTVVKPPAGAATSTWYNATWPRADSQKVGMANATRVTFSYTAAGLLSGVVQPGVTESYTYDGSLGNVSATTSNDQSTAITRDSLGAERTITDGAGFLTETIHRNLLGRVDSTKAVSQATTRLFQQDTTTPSGGSANAIVARQRKAYWNVVPSRTRTVINTYDVAGNLIRVDRKASGDGTTNTYSAWSYDAAHRVTATSQPMGVDSSWYDPSGLVIRQKTLRGHEIIKEYDAGGRLLVRASPTVVTPLETCSTCTQWMGYAIPMYDVVKFPYFPTKLPTGGETLDAAMLGDVELFTYDLAGRMLTANNTDAKVSRTYYPGGSLKADTTRMRAYDPAAATNYSSLVTGLQYEYDILGRRTRRTDSFGWQQTYAYQDSLGQLARTAERQIAGGDSTAVVFRWDDAGRLLADSVLNTVSGKPIYSTNAFDSNGHLVRRSQYGVYGGAGTQVFRDSMVYDTRGKQTKRMTVAAQFVLSDTVNMQYDGFGALLSVERWREFGSRNYTTDEFDTDALGNARGAFMNRWTNDGISLVTNTFSGERITARIPDKLPDVLDEMGTHPAVKMVDTAGYGYDAGGNQSQTDQRVWNRHASMELWNQSATGSAYTRSFYDANNRMRLSQRTVDTQGLRHVVIEYRYDALGRRILMRTRADSLATCTGDTGVEPPCLSTLDRFVWDGDQLLVELRARGGYAQSMASLETTTSSGAFFGQIRYMHALGIDAPLTVRKDAGTAFVPHASGRGGYEGGTYVAGTEMTGYHWPARMSAVTLGPDTRLEPPAVLGWFGSLLDGKTDANGQMYMRNRYYDPATGRFTQLDPIGMLGGMNLYAHANSDPINQADPNGTSCERKGSDRLSCSDVQPGDWITVSFFLGGASGRSAMNSFMSAGLMNWTPGTCRGGFNASQCDQLAVVQALLTVHSDPFCSSLGTRSTRRFQRGRLQYNAGIIRFPFPFHKIKAVGWAPPGFTVLSSELFLGGAYEATDELFDTNTHEERHHGDLLRRESVAESAEARCR